jgi:hypothetical protein
MAWDRVRRNGDLDPLKLIAVIMLVLGFILVTAITVWVGKQPEALTRPSQTRDETVR